MAKLEARLPAVLQGVDRVKDSADLQGFEQLCVSQKRNADAVKLYADAFVADVKLANDMQALHRYNAACHAALAAAGKGIDAGRFDDKERARLRQQALDWLHADLAHWSKKAASEKPGDRTLVQQKMKHWQKDTDLTGIREKDALAKLPVEERAAWEKLWAGVAEALKKAEGGK